MSFHRRSMGAIAPSDEIRRIAAAGTSLVGASRLQVVRWEADLLVVSDPTFFDGYLDPEVGHVAKVATDEDPFCNCLTFANVGVCPHTVAAYLMRQRIPRAVPGPAA